MQKDPNSKETRDALTSETSDVMDESQQDSPVKKKRKPRFKRWLLRSFHVFAYGSLLLVILYFVYGPEVIRGFLLQNLNSAGLGGIGIGEADLRIGSLRLKNLVGREGRMSVDRLEVSYSQTSLSRREVDDIEMYGLEWLIMVKDGQVDLGLPEGVLDREADGSGEPTDLPFQSITLKHSVVYFDYEGLRIRVPISGSFQREDGYKLSLLLKLEPFSVPVILTGLIDTHTGETDLHLEPGDWITSTDGDAQGAWDLFLNRMQLDFNIDLKIHEGNTQLDADFTYASNQVALPLGAEMLSLTEPEITMQMSMINDQVMDASFKMLARNGRYGEMQLDDPRVTMTGDDLKTELKISAHRMEVAEIDLASTLPPLSELFLGPTQITAPVSWRVFAVIPRSLTQYLSYDSWTVDGEASIDCQGSGVFNLDRAELSKDPWYLALSDVLINISPIDLVNPAQGLKLSGVTANTRARVNLDSRQLLIKPVEDPVVKVFDVEGIEGNKNTKIHVKRLLGDLAPLLEMRLSQRKTQFAFDFAKRLLRAEVGEARTSVSLSNWQVMGNRFDGLEGVLKFGAKLEDQSISVDYLEMDLLATDAQLSFGEFEPIIGPLNAKVRSTAPMTYDIDAQLLEMPFSVALSDPVFRWPDWDIIADSLTMTGLMNWHAQRGLRLDTVVRLEGGKMDQEKLKLGVSDVSIEAPFTHGLSAERQAVGTFTIGQVKRGKYTGEGFTGKLAWHDLAIQAEADWKLEQLLPLKATLGLNFNDNFTMDLHAWLPETVIEDQKAIEKIVPELEGFSITGGYRVDVRLLIEDGRLSPLIKADIVNGELENKKQRTQIEGIEGQVVINSLAPLRTQEGQRIKIKSANYGGFAMNNGQLSFRLNDWNKVSVERTVWDLPHGGTVFIHSFDFDITDPVVAVELFVERMDVVKWIEKAYPGQMSGSVEMNGRIPLKFQDGKVILDGDGFLYSTPKKGALQLTDGQVMNALTGYLTPVFEKHEMGKLALERFKGAMRNLEVYSLVLELVEQNGKNDASLVLTGKGKDDPFQEIGGLEIYLRDIQEIVDQAMKANLTADRIKDTFEDLFNR